MPTQRLERCARLLVLIGGCLASHIASSALTSHAHAHAPAVRALAVGSTDAGEPGPLALALPGFGLALRAAASEPLAYACDALLGARPTDRAPALAYRSDGSLLLASADGVRVLTANGCPLPSEPNEPSTLHDAAVFALALRRGSPELGATELGAKDIAYAAVAGRQAGLWRSDDGGRHWQLRAPLAHAEAVTALWIDPDASDSIVLSQRSGALSTVWISTDGGSTLQALAQDRDLTLLHSRSGPAPLLWALARDTASVGNRGFAILRAESAAGPWQPMLRVNYFGGFAIDPGGRIWVGDEGGGLYRSDDHGASFRNLASETAVACLAYEHDALWACSPGTTLEPALTSLREADPTPQPVISLAAVDRLVHCGPALDVERVCASAWNEWQRDVLLRDLSPRDAGTPTDAGASPPDAATAVGTSEPDAGTSAADAADAAGAVPPPARDAASSCSLNVARTADGRAPALLLLAAALGCLLVARRRARC